MKEYKVSPYQTPQDSVLNRTIYKCWPKERFNEISDINSIKKFYNDCYDDLKNKLVKELNKIHPAGVILEAYKQLELWTVIYFEDGIDQVSGPKEFAPIGRYGWRYVIEIALERLESGEFPHDQDRPDEKQMNLILTYLIGMGQSSEFSNYLHYLNKQLSTAKILFSPDLFRELFTLEPSENELFQKIRESIFKKTDWDKYSRFSPNSDLITAKTNDFLEEFYSITIEEIQLIIKAIIEGISNVTGASITVQPLDDFVDILNSLTGIHKSRIVSLIDLSFLNINTDTYQERDFLRKNQQTRMLFHAGIVLKLESKLEAIYDKESAKRDDIRNSSQHILISPRMFAEWVDVFITKLSLGQREDLKINSESKKSIAEIESFYRISTFEKEVTRLLEVKGNKCLRIEKVNGKPIPCGEIDIIAYNDSEKVIRIIECKALAPIIDARGLGQVVNDHFRQKKYHQKFLKKITWVKSNIQLVRNEFLRRIDVEIELDVTFQEYYVTGSNATLKFLVEEYEVMTFEEFDSLLK